MSSLIQRLEEKAGYINRHSDFGKMIVQSSCQETGEIQPMGFATQKEYDLGLQIAVKFWANQAQYSDARIDAERYLAAELFSQQLAFVSRIQSAIFDGDAKAALHWLAELRDSMTG